MASFLLELFSEEIPARMQSQAAEHLLRAFLDALKEAGLAQANARSFVTPRRVAIIADDLPEAQPDVSAEKKGPKVNAPQAAIDGFLRSTGLPLEKLEKRMVGKDETYFAVIESKGQPTAIVLKAIIEKILAAFPWPKSMRWGSGETRWVRPLHSILCIFAGKIVPVEFASVTAGNMTYGHRFLAPEAITISKPEDYAPLLYKAHVIADAEERKAFILKSAEELAGKHGLTLKRDDGLLAEVTGLVEWPVLLMGTIDAKFMDLPPEVLVSEMRAHQKYFALLDKAGAMSDKFLITSNMVTEGGGKSIVAGNERVLRARLSDGRFFWDQDRKKPLSEWAKGLKGVTFHTKIGTIAEKVERVKVLSTLRTFIPGANEELVERAVQLCKADLVTGMVGEFPELQGIMGRYYALAQNEDESVADAIRDHYFPLGPDSPVPTKPISICVALADKIDTLVSMFFIDEKPTGSKDPYALRRMALGIIRIIFENNIRLPLNLLIGFACIVMSSIDMQHGLTRLKAVKDFLSENKEFYTEYDPQNAKLDFIDKEKVKKLQSSISTFISDRLKVQLKDQGIRHDLISAVMANGDDDLVRVVARAKALQEFVSTEQGISLLAAERRARNIVNLAEKEGSRYYQEVNSALLKEKAEKSLYLAIEKRDREIRDFIKNENFPAAMRLLVEIGGPINTFFGEILVNIEEQELRANRLRLLSSFCDYLENIADFSRIEG